MSRLRVLVVDDAVVVRRLVTDALAADPELEVVGTAANGSIALQKITQVNPDIITLDVEMPEMDGLETLRRLRKTHPRLPVIMFSTLTARGATATLDALALGASDYVTKPANVGSVTAGIAAVREQLVPKIKALCGRRVAAPLAPALRPAAPVAGVTRAAAPAATGPRPPVSIVAIGVSTGGPNALAVVLPALPADLPVPVVIVQHMPPMFTRLLAGRLDGDSPLTVREAAGGETLTPGTALIAPGDYHMVLVREGQAVRTRLNQEPPENSCRPAVDPLFRSVADIYGPGALGIILTGMGHDGLAGSGRIRDAGGRVFVQDEKTSVVWGMPGFVFQRGLADAALPLEQIGPEIRRRVYEGRRATLSA